MLKDAKVNAELFIKHILKPVMHENVPRLYGADADKVILHIDSAPAHTAKAVYKWLNDRNISYF